MSIPVLHEDNHVLVVDKPANIPCQEDASGDPDMLTLLKADLKVRHDKPGNVFLGLVHRLDRPTSGVMVFAKTSKAASRLSEQVRQRLMSKYYTVVVEGAVAPSEGVFTDYLVKDGRTNRVRVCEATVADAKHAELTYEVLAHDKGVSLVRVNLVTGRSHQIRVQFASRNAPVWGDHRYGSGTGKQQLALHASSLSFDHPTTKERMMFEATLPERVPFGMLRS